MGPVRGVIDVLHDSTASVPDKLYRYSHIENGERLRYAKEVFEEDRIYFPSPDGFNDPFDSTMKWVEPGSIDEWRCFYREEGLRLCRTDAERANHLRYEGDFLRLPEYRQEFVKGLEADVMAKRRELGVLCMTQTKTSIPMWAHYAANHRGFCLEFQTNNDFFKCAKKVDYRRQLAQVDIFSSWDARVRRAAEALLTKSEDWQCEEEWRIIDLDNGVGHQKCPPEAITGVILGCRMPMEARQHITDWCKKRNPQPTLYKAKIKDGEFGLDIDPICY